MANILNNILSKNIKTPVLSSDTLYNSSLRGSAELAVKKVYVKTDKRIKKEGSELKVNDKVFDLKNKTVLDLMYILYDEGVEVKNINDKKNTNYPALCILDFDTLESFETKVNCSPFNLNLIKEFKGTTIVTLDEPIFSINTLIEGGTLRKDYKLNNNFLLINNLKKNTKLCYSLQTTEFILLLDSKFTTKDREVLSRYLDSNND